MPSEYGITVEDVGAAFDAAMWQQIVSLKTRAEEIETAKQAYLRRWSDMRRMQYEKGRKS